MCKSIEKGINYSKGRGLLRPIVYACEPIGMGHVYVSLIPEQTKIIQSWLNSCGSIGDHREVIQVTLAYDITNPVFELNSDAIYTATMNEIDIAHMMELEWWGVMVRLDSPEMEIRTNELGATDTIPGQWMIIERHSYESGIFPNEGYREMLKENFSKLLKKLPSLTFTNEQAIRIGK